MTIGCKLLDVSTETSNLLLILNPFGPGIPLILESGGPGFSTLFACNPLILESGGPGIALHCSLSPAL